MGRDSHFSDVLASPKVTGFLVWTDLVRGSRGWVGHGSVQREHHEEGSKRRNHWTCDISFFFVYEVLRMYRVEFVELLLLVD
jgi:hypothetical protein